METNNTPWFFTKKSNDKFLTLDKLKSIWVNQNEIDTKVQQDIQKVKSNTLSKEKVAEILNNAPKWVNKREIITWLLDRGFTLEWFEQPKKQEPQEEIKQPTTGIWAFAQNIKPDGWYLEWTKRTLSSIEEWVWNVVWGVITNIPSMVANIGAFAVDVADFFDPIDNIIEKVTGEKSKFDIWDFADHLQQDWLDTKNKLRSALWVDPDAMATSIWELGSEIATFFIPWGQASLATKFSKVPETIKKVKLVWKWLENMAKNSPKTYTLLKNAIVWGTEAGKFWIVSEWEISPTWVVIWAVTNPVIDKTGKVISSLMNKDTSSLLTKVIKPSTTKGNNKIITENMNIIWQSLKANSKKPQTINQLYDDLVDIQKKLYTDKINPALKEVAWNWAKVNISWLIDDIIPKISEVKSVAWKNLSTLFGRSKEAKEFAKTLENLRKLWDLDLLSAETLKQYTSALSMANKSSPWTLSSLQETFVQKLNKALWNKMDDIITNVKWVWIKPFKREYSAITTHLDDLNRKIISENKLTWDNLFSWLGKIAWIREIASGNLKEWIAQLLTWKILKLLKDPNEILKKAIAELYKTPWIITTSKVVWGTSWLWGGAIDKNQRKKIWLE